MAIREGRWDCPSCGSTAIYGRHVECPGCGKPRPAGVRFYLTSDAPVVTDPERLAEAMAGADWICEHCDISNRATFTRCAGCGAYRGSRNPLQKIKRYTTEDTPRTGDGGRDPVHAPAAASAETGVGGGSGGSGGSGGWKPPPAPPKLTGTRGPQMAIQHRVGLAVAGVMALVVLGGMIGELRGDPTYDPIPVLVEASVWKREIVVQEHRIVPGEGWELPDSATEVKEESRVREHRQEPAGYRTVIHHVPRQARVITGYREEKRTVQEQGARIGTRTYACGTRDLGNGYFEDVECTEPEYETIVRTERVSVPIYKNVTVIDTVAENQPVYRQVPVMATWYTYRVPQWTVVDTVRMAGTWMLPPEWPRTKLAPNQRELWRLENYELILRSADTPYPWRLNLPEEEWRAYRPGQRVAYAGSGGRRDRAALLPTDSLPACRRWSRGRGRPPPDSLGYPPRATARR